MNVTHLKQLLSQRSPLGPTGAALDAAVSKFSTNSAEASSTIRQLRTADPAGFDAAALKLLMEPAGERSAGVRYIAGIMRPFDAFIEAMLDEKIELGGGAIFLARNLCAVDPMVDVQLIRKAVAAGGGDATQVRKKLALRALALAESASDGARLTSYLPPFLRHPAPEVRSKAALIFGRANLNVARVKQMMESEDSRVRANAVESLWGWKEAQVRDLMWKAAQDPAPRVAVNGLIGLCEAGDAEARARLDELRAGEDEKMRAAAEWALERLAQAEASEGGEEPARETAEANPSEAEPAVV